MIYLIALYIIFLKLIFLFIQSFISNIISINNVIHIYDWYILNDNIIVIMAKILYVMFLDFNNETEIIDKSIDMEYAVTAYVKTNVSEIAGNVINILHINTLKYVFFISKTSTTIQNDIDNTISANIPLYQGILTSGKMKLTNSNPHLPEENVKPLPNIWLVSS